MLGGFRERSALRTAALWAVAFVFAVKMLVAPGMMPVADAGGIHITICTGTGPVDAVLDVAGKQHGDQGKAMQEACPFAVAAIAGPPAEPATMLLPALPALLAAIALPPLPARAPPSAAPPPSTGPPAFA